jgi:hypothetical protein
MEVELNGTKLRVHEDGRIFSWTRGSWLERKCNAVILNKRTEYASVKIELNKKNYVWSRVVAYAYLGLDITNPKLEIDHIDRNPSNNAVSNLRVVSHTENQWNKRPTKNVRRCNFPIKWLVGSKFYKTEDEAKLHGLPRCIPAHICWRGIVITNGVRKSKYFKTEAEALLWVEEQKSIRVI